MIQKLLPFLLVIIGIGAGVGGGITLRPDPSVVMLDPCGDMHMEESHDEEETMGDSAFEYVKLNNQFVIPDLDDGKVTAMVVLSLSLEAENGQREPIYAKEPKLRDAFLQILFDHANMGGFKGEFTSTIKMDTLKLALTEVAQSFIGKGVHQVLVTDIVRQDI